MAQLKIQQAKPSVTVYEFWPRLCEPQSSPAQRACVRPW